MVVFLIILLWTIHKDTKNESNSQLIKTVITAIKCCELYTKIQKMKAIHNPLCTWGACAHAVNYTQRYKKWKQFTTIVNTNTQQSSCELYTKIQKMKAIHNILAAALSFTLLWTIHKDTKNESNSQQCSLITPVSKRCELYTKIQKMKAIHNNLAGIMSTANAVNYTQRYNN